MPEFSEAEQAFIDTRPADTFEGVPVDGTPDEQAEANEQVAETATPVQEGTTESSDSFSRTDLDALLADISDPAAQEAVTRAYKGFQGDYTKSKQELAEQRKELGDLDPAQAREAVEFYTSLQSDPAFAMEVHEYLTKAFEQMGLTPAQAANAASNEIQNTPAPEVSPPADGEDPDEYLKSQVDQLNGRLSAYEQREQERLARQQEDETAASLLQQEMALRHSNPNLQEEDFDRIYDLALSTGGDLFAAAKTYDDWNASVIERYMAQKASVTDSVSAPQAAPASPAREMPQTPRGDVDLEAVHRGAMKTLMNRMANQD